MSNLGPEDSSQYIWRGREVRWTVHGGPHYRTPAMEAFVDLFWPTDPDGKKRTVCPAVTAGLSIDYASYLVVRLGIEKEAESVLRLGGGQALAQLLEAHWSDALDFGNKEIYGARYR